MRITAVVTLPNGEKVRIRETGYRESDTNAWVETSDAVLTWEDGDEVGEELTDEQFNASAYDGESGCLTIFEYVCKYAQWRAE
jgi:hypothetical protein